MLSGRVLEEETESRSENGKKIEKNRKTRRVHIYIYRYNIEHNVVVYRRESSDEKGGGRVR